MPLPRVLRPPRPLRRAAQLVSCAGACVAFVLVWQGRVPERTALDVPRDLVLAHGLDTRVVRDVAALERLHFDCDRVFELHELAFGDVSRAEIDTHWSGWSWRAWRVLPPAGDPVALTLFDARRPDVELAFAALAPADGARDVAFAWRGAREREHVAQVAFLLLDARRVTVLSHAEIRGAAAPSVHDRAAEHVDTRVRSYCDGREWPRLGAISWCGALAAEVASNVLWPRRVRTAFLADGDERDAACAELPLARWPWPVWLVALERADVREPSGAGVPR